MAAVHFLLVYDLAQQRIVLEESFTQIAAAMQRYAECERNHIGQEDVEIVLIGADSIETVRHTHSSYFEGRKARRSKYLVGLG